MSVRRRAGSVATWVLGPTFTRHYLRSLRVRGPRAPYEAKSAWTSRYESAVARGELDDATTLAEGARPAVVRYHYNAVENAIVELSLDKRFPAHPTVLDVGSGAGHWIDFYRDTLGAPAVVGVEISTSAVQALAGRYEAEHEVTIVEGDVSEEGFDLERRFDVVNAVGVLFHVVEDDDWQRALANLGAHLAPGGLLLVAEHVGLLSHDVDFRRLEPAAGHPEGVALVTKRIRSKRRWRSGARAAGLRVMGFEKIRKQRSMRTPANRLIVLASRS